MRYGILAVGLCLSGCFAWGGSPWGGLGEPCYTSGGAPCDGSLVCDDETNICGPPKPCTNSFDCGAKRACTGGICVDYAASCVADADCHADYFCDGSSCAKQLKIAAPCQRATQCISGACADAVCCESSCNGTCESCIAATNAIADGKCAPYAAGTDPEQECAAGLGCDGAGACTKKALASACESGAECATGFCADGVCCGGACDGVCQKCGTDGICARVTSLEDAGTCDDANVGGNCTQAPCTCDATGQCLNAKGSKCADNTNCDGTNKCALRDAVCCDTTCTGICMACVLSLTGKSTGTCAPILARTERDKDECAGPWTCDGKGGCVGLANGEDCDPGRPPSDCASGQCYTDRSRLNIKTGEYPGICCNSSCDNVCTSCLTIDTGRTKGYCMDVSAGTNKIGVMSCDDGLWSRCDGAGSCVHY